MKTVLFYVFLLFKRILLISRYLYTKIFASKIKNNFNFFRYVIFTKIKYSSDELMIKIRKFVREPIKRDLAVNILEFVRTKGALGATCADLQVTKWLIFEVNIF